MIWRRPRRRRSVWPMSGPTARQDLRPGLRSSSERHPDPPFASSPSRRSTVSGGATPLPVERHTSGQAGGKSGGGAAWLRSRTTLPRDVLVLGVIAFCVAVGFGVLVPVLPVFARTFGVGNAAVGAVISMFALHAPGSQPAVRPADRLGRGADHPRHRDLHRGDLERPGRHRPELRPTAGAPRRRRGRLGHVHRVGHDLAAPFGRSGSARPGHGRLPGRVPARRDDRSGGGRPAGLDLADGAVLLLRRHAGGGRAWSGCCSCVGIGPDRPRRTRRRPVRSARSCATPGSRRPA